MSDAPSKPLDRAERGRIMAQRRSAARLAAVQALYQLEMTGASARSVRLEFEAHRLGKEVDGVEYNDADPEYFGGIIDSVVRRQREIDPLIDEVLKASWPLGRIDPTLRAVFRACAAELHAMPRTPAKVAISEYLDVAKAFFQGDEARFANGVLDTLARRLRSEEFTR